MNPSRKLLANNLTRRMSSLNLTKSAVSKAAGMSRTALDDILECRRSAGLDAIQALAVALDTSLGWLFSENKGSDEDTVEHTVRQLRKEIRDLDILVAKRKIEIATWQAACDGGRGDQTEAARQLAENKRLLDEDLRLIQVRNDVLKELEAKYLESQTKGANPDLLTRLEAIEKRLPEQPEAQSPLIRELVSILTTLEEGQVLDLLKRAKGLQAAAETRRTGRLPEDPVEDGKVTLTPKRKPV